ncbi:hypothetical protein Bca4012_021125 [Brassica carinata]|uniref:C-JID domain-containing protein n=1 Tax=Brassica carinata TaxID=52824 RepID=A0A8X7WE86_BRACI|nr:hypothetical protein Bca52824_000418 [Brassica carinata]
MTLSGSENLIEMSDLSKATNLEKLQLKDCYSLVKLSSSIPHPNKLRKLDLRNCRNLETIPTGMNINSLEDLDLYGCSMLRTFPQISTNIVDLCLDETAIEEIPSNLHMGNLRLEKLSYLSMRKLKSKKLWERVQPLTPIMAMLSSSLVFLYLSDIPTLVELPSSFENLHQLWVLEIKNCVNLETLPTGINLRDLNRLNLIGCSRLRTFPDISTNIEWLYLSETAIEEVPCWIDKFSKLEILVMKGCNNLECVNLDIFEHMLGLHVNFSDCRELTGVGWSDSPTRVVDNFERRYIKIDFTNCFNLDHEALFQQKAYLGCLLLLSGEEVPSYFTHRTIGTSSSLTIPLLHSTLTQSFLKFRACIVYNSSDNTSKVSFCFNFRSRTRFNSVGKARVLWGHTKIYDIWSNKKDSHLFVFDCHIGLRKGSVILTLEIDFSKNSPSEYRIKEWGFICSQNLIHTNFRK